MYNHSLVVLVSSISPTPTCIFVMISLVQLQIPSVWLSKYFTTGLNSSSTLSFLTLAYIILSHGQQFTWNVNYSLTLGATKPGPLKALSLQERIVPCLLGSQLLGTLQCCGQDRCGYWQVLLYIMQLALHLIISLCLCMCVCLCLSACFVYRY